jgi:hypothetical protein
MLLGEVGKLREERRNIQLFVGSIPDRFSHCLICSLAKLAPSCVCEASTILVACLIRTGECVILLLCGFIHLLPPFILGNHPPIPSPRSQRLTYRRTSLLHPVPKPLVRPRGALFAHEVHSGVVAGRLRPGRDPLSRRYHRQAHNQECRPTVRRPARGIPGKVNIVNFIPPKAITNSCEQCNLELSIRRRRASPWFNWHQKRHQVASSAPARPVLVDTSDTCFLTLTIL